MPRAGAAFVPGAPVFRAGRQLVKLRAVVPLSLGTAAVLGYAAWSVLTSFGLHPTEGGVLKPLALRGSLAALFLLLGAGIAAGIVVYVRHCYVSRIDAGDAPGRFRVTVAGLVRPRVLDVEAASLAPAAYHEGAYRTHRLRGAAPWFALRVPGRRLPLIVDLQGDVLDEAAFAWLLG